MLVDQLLREIIAPQDINDDISEREKFKRRMLPDQMGVWNRVSDPEVAHVQLWLGELLPRLIREDCMRHVTTDVSGSPCPQDLGNENASILLGIGAKYDILKANVTE